MTCCTQTSQHLSGRLGPFPPSTQSHGKIMAVRRADRWSSWDTWTVFSCLVLLNSQKRRSEHRIAWSRLGVAIAAMQGVAFQMIFGSDWFKVAVISFMFGQLMPAVSCQ